MTDGVSPSIPVRVRDLHMGEAELHKVKAAVASDRNAIEPSAGDDATVMRRNIDGFCRDHGIPGMQRSVDKIGRLC